MSNISIADTYNLFTNGNKLTNLECLKLRAHCQQAVEVNSKLGPVFRLATNEAARIVDRLTSICQARDLL